VAFADASGTWRLFGLSSRCSLMITISFENRCHPLSGTEAAVPSPTPLVETATITARGLAGQSMKCGGECARLAEADIERNRCDGQLTIRQ
jgi:hypothetical protein